MNRYAKRRRIAAIFGIVFLVALYLFTLVCAFIQSEWKESLLMASIAGTIIIPVILYIYLFILLRIQQKNESKDSNSDSL